MKIVLFVLALLAAGFAIWQYKGRADADAAQRARVLQLDPRKVEPATRALLLLETIPDLRDAERDVAVKQLRTALAAVPRGLMEHTPPFPVEALRFSGDGSALLWYGKATGPGIRIESWAERAPRVHAWSSGASNVTFTDAQGKETFTDEAADPKDPAEVRVVMSHDGGYLSLVQDGALSIWRVRDVMAGRSSVRPAFLAAVPYATNRLHCVLSADLCGMESPGRFTFVDVKKGTILRSVAVDRNAIVHLGPSGRLAGVAAPRGGITIHAARHGRQVNVATPGLTLVDFAFSADEKTIVALGSDGVLHSYDAATGKPGPRSEVVRREPWQPTARIETVGDGRFVVWDTAKVRLLSADLSAVAARFDGDIALAKTDARGKRLAIARRKGPLTLWDVATDPALPVIDTELIASACDHVGRPLTAEEWATYIPNRSYDPRCR